MPYTNPDIVRQFASSVTDEVITDVDILAVSTNISDPVVDGHLSGLGAPFSKPYPAIVVTISSLFSISVIFDDRYYQTSEQSDWGKKKWELAESLLKQVKGGTLTDNGIGRAASLRVSDPTDPKPSTTVFVGTDETSWKVRTETKASS